MIDYIASIDDKSTEVKIIDHEFILVNGIKKKYFITELNEKKYLLKVDNKIFEASLLSNSNGTVDVFINKKLFKVNVLTSLQDKALKLIQQSEVNKSHQTKIKSPMPGLVLKINKNIGDIVYKGETVLVLEAMKMENEIKAPVDGKIEEMYAEPGLAIEKNFLLFSIK
ncbi:MAG TPA: acetyl-CoA carboxylase biotin carboxyl carrier protein subunit [Ignavibacteriaceae bacterium]|nr:acetyl-CoA carboxylase biotin carboxyl carrier protein subunit [Ignavibacteriaceae bacterium]